MAEKGIIVGVNVNKQANFNEQMEELKNLVEACGIEVTESFVQNAEVINNATCLGKGKLAELSEEVQKKDATVLVFLHDLTGSQMRNISKVVEAEILDRTGLILEIFASRARTREAKLQVEMVRLQYELPRLAGASTNLSRQGGGIGGGAGGRNKGAGETKLSLDKRKVEERINQLKKELEIMEEQRKTQRNMRKRTGLPVVSLVGYTNAGKSSIMNCFVEQFVKEEDKKVLEKNMLFATLDTSVRRIPLTKTQEILLTDTVGFVSSLPHNLVKAFRSTLEEVCEADLLLHVVDVSNPDYRNQIEVTKETLKSIHAEHIPVLYVFNKSDLLKPQAKQVLISESIDSNHILFSAKDKDGFGALCSAIRNRMLPKEVSAAIYIPYDHGNMIAKVNAEAEIKKSEWKEEGIVYEIVCDESFYHTVQPYLFENQCMM
ncbi:MAG: GTPase HflX [Lachnospiraceae bacterium]|nr:GTPase HflX [Lachnospiraceae bacterium]